MNSDSKKDCGHIVSKNKEKLAEDAALLLSAISYYKNTGNMDAAVQKAPTEWRKYLPEITNVYEQTRKSNNVIDFDDMVYECAELLQNNMQVRKKWQNRFSHILMDEFQDINPMQYRVIQLLAKAPFNFFAVGDDDQAIYGFRGSNPDCLKQFVKDYSAKQIFLNKNYRSYGEIVRASSLVIAENKNRFVKNMTAQKEYETGSEKNRVSIHTFTEREEQYEYLAQVLSEKKEKETCAVLFRTNAHMQGFAAILHKKGIPFSMKEKVTNIYEQTNIKDIMAYLRLASGEKSRQLWLQIMNKPSRYISREALAGEKEELTLSDMKAYYDRITEEHSAYCYVDKIKNAIRIFEKQLQYLKEAPPYLAVQYVRRVIGYDRAIQNTEKVNDILEWLSEDAKGYHSLQEWLNAQKNYKEMLLRKESLQDRASNSKEQKGEIQLMTVHASKGLEFDRVWIPDCNEKIFPNGSMPDREACEEERRIFYVAMTRAKKNLELLGLTGTKERPRFLSRFLNPLWKDYSSSSTTSSNSH